jgi:hypothetical protein
MAKHPAAGIPVWEGRRPAPSISRQGPRALPPQALLLLVLIPPFTPAGKNPPLVAAFGVR